MTTPAGLRDACAIAREASDGCARSRQKLRVGQAFPNCEPPARIAYCCCIFTLRKEMTMTLARLRIAVAALALAATPALAQDKVRFQTDWIPSGEHAMYYGGWQKGIFAARRHRHHDHARLRLRRHRDQAGRRRLRFRRRRHGRRASRRRARQNVPVKTIAVLYTQSPHSLFVLKSSGITSFKGLEGKKIGITPGNSHKFYFPKVAEKRRHRSQQDHLGEHGRRGDGGAADRQEHRRGALLFDPPLLHEQGGEGGRRGDRRRCRSSRSGSRSTRPRSSPPTR